MIVDEDLYYYGYPFPLVALDELESTRSSGRSRDQSVLCMTSGVCN